MAKQLAFDHEAREHLRIGVAKLAKAVRTTFGPRGRTAVIDKGWGNPTVTKDGVSVAEEVELNNPYENLGAQLLKEAATKTSDVAGDGTTTATVLAEAIFNQSLRFVSAGASVAAIARGIKIAVEKAFVRISGSDKYLVGQTAAQIRKIKKPEPYQGKGIRYVGEHIRRKAGKSAK